MSNPVPDVGIPVLTEVIPTYRPAATLETPIPEPATPVAAPKKTAPMPDQVRPFFDEEQWNRMELEIRERVLHQLLERVDAMLEQRVRDSLADILQLAVSSLAEEIREGLRSALKEVVMRAVAQEITKLKTTKN